MELNQAIALMPAPTPATFDGLFRRMSATVRMRRAARTTLTGLSVGLGVGALAAAALWFANPALPFGESGAFGLSPWCVFAGATSAVLGAAVGAFAARRARWSDREVALFLDARLHTSETVTSAIACSREDSDRALATRTRAERALASSAANAGRVRVLFPVHGLSLFGVLVIAGFSLAPSPHKAAEKPVPSPEKRERAEVRGLERIEALERADGLSDADAERLRKLARDARELSRDLARGVPKREALARVGRLRDDIARERERFSDAKERPGLEAAVNALAGEGITARAAKALDAGDVVGFDEEMQRLANAAEASSREKARKALESARDAARGKQSQKLAELLDRQRKLFEERGAAAEALRELAKLLEGQLDEEGREALRNFEARPDLDALENLADALSDVLAELDESERQRLLERLAKNLAKSELADPDLAQKLGGKLDKEALREALRELASEDAARERALGEAERGAAEAERGLMPIPVPGRGGGSPQSGGATPGASGPGPGQGPGGDRSAEEAAPRPAQGIEEFRAKAEAQLMPGAPLGTRALGRAPARPGETADRAGSGRLGSVAAQEVGAVENSDVPEEYRDHVGRYFQP